MKNMLVVVDYQKDFVDGALGFPGADALDEGIAGKIRQAQANGDIIVYTLDSHLDDYLNTREGKALPVPHCLVGTPGHELFGKTGEALRGCPGAIRLPKPTFGVAPEVLIAFLAKYMGKVERIEFVGLVTNMCVLANVCCFQALFPYAQIVVDAGLVASFDKELHQKALDVMRGMQIEVV